MDWKRYLPNLLQPKEVGAASELAPNLEKKLFMQAGSVGTLNPHLQSLLQSGLGRTNRSPHVVYSPASVLSSCTTMPTTVPSPTFRNSNARINPPRSGYIRATSASSSPHLAGFPAKAKEFLASPTLSSNPKARKVCIPARLGITEAANDTVFSHEGISINNTSSNEDCFTQHIDLELPKFYSNFPSKNFSQSNIHMEGLLQSVCGITQQVPKKPHDHQSLWVQNHLSGITQQFWKKPHDHQPLRVQKSHDHQPLRVQNHLFGITQQVPKKQHDHQPIRVQKSDDHQPLRVQKSHDHQPLMVQNHLFGITQQVPKKQHDHQPIRVQKSDDHQPVWVQNHLFGITQQVPKKPHDHQPLSVQNSALVNFPASNRLKRHRGVPDSSHESCRHIDEGVSLERQAPLDEFQTGSGGLEDIVLHNLKRPKKDNLLSPFNESERPRILAPLENQPSSSTQLSPLQQQPQPSVSFHSEVMQVDMDSLTDFEPRFEILTNPSECIVSHQPEEKNPTDISNTGENVKVLSDNIECETMDAFPNGMDVDCKDDQVQTRTDFKVEQEMKSKNLKLVGISMADFFTKEQIKEHIMSFGQSVDQSMLEDKGNREEICQLCGLDKIPLASEPIYCSGCFARIKKKANYYCTTDQDTTDVLCVSCHKKGFKAGKLWLNNICFYKEKLSRMKNDQENYASWVRCDKCLGWQHQICALFNDKIDHEDKLYTCPNCLLKELENGDCPPLPYNVAFRSKDLPETMLSNHIESRLFKRLKEEREERAKVAGKNFDEVPGAQDLVVRIVSSVDKKVEVKKKFLEYLGDESYPAEFSYTSKAILLFQKIEGVDICLFCVYVQEFGSECSHPNQRCVYISYLDSVKLFRPDIVAVTGEPLRRFVYHELLIGYLDYAKRRGFANCYLWVCPPSKGDEYIFSCHPENQKTLKKEKLRQWYLSMLKKAGSENIVVSYTNLHDKFFLQNGESNCKITAAHLPHFDGDYWYINCEEIIKKVEEEIRKKPMSMRTLKAMGHKNSSGSVNKDVLLMQKLKEHISTHKEDFVVIHLQYVCTRCQNMVLSGNRWFCNQCKNFHLCDRCNENQALHLRGTHITISGEQHMLSQVRVDVPLDTMEEDLILDNCLFETRQTFLNFCYKNHYQFDTLGRAKHSSLITLNHLQNHTVVRNAKNCNVCHKNADFVHSWSCETCPEFNICAACYREKDGSDHIHKLTQRSSRIICGTNNKEACQRPIKVVQTDTLLAVLQHACKCCSTKDDPCSFSPNCHKLKRLFHHARNCTVRVSGRCVSCKKIWIILNLHSKNCTDPDCYVPRCRDLKEHAKLME